MQQNKSTGYSNPILLKRPVPMRQEKFYAARSSYSCQQRPKRLGQKIDLL